MVMWCCVQILMNVAMAQVCLHCPALLTCHDNLFPLSCLVLSCLVLSTAKLMVVWCCVQISVNEAAAQLCLHWLALLTHKDLFPLSDLVWSGLVLSCFVYCKVDGGVVLCSDISE